MLRGNSGSGKTSTAVALRALLGPGVALVQQDVLRRIVLREPDLPGGANIALISATTRFALNHGYGVILEGILSAGRYGEMLSSLANDYGGAFYYFDVSLTETLRRHATRPQSAEFGADTMRGWYRHRDLLCGVEERIIDEKSCLDNMVDRVLRDVYPDRVGRTRCPPTEAPKRSVNSHLLTATHHPTCRYSGLPHHARDTDT